MSPLIRKNDFKSNAFTDLGKKTNLRILFLNICKTNWISKPQFPLPDKEAGGVGWGVYFPGGPVVEKPPVSAGDVGLIPGPGRSHMLWGN